MVQDLGLAKQPCWDSGPMDADRSRAQEGTQLPAQGPPVRPLLPHRPQWPGAPAPMGLNLSLSLSAPSCFPSPVENGSLVTNMASGHWVMRSLFPLPAPQRHLLFPSRPLSLALPLPPTHPNSLLPAPPAPRCTPRLCGVTAAWPGRGGLTPARPRAPWAQPGLEPAAAILGSPITVAPASARTRRRGGWGSARGSGAPRVPCDGESGAPCCQPPPRASPCTETR